MVPYMVPKRISQGANMACLTKGELKRPTEDHQAALCFVQGPPCHRSHILLLTESIKQHLGLWDLLLLGRWHNWAPGTQAHGTLALAIPGTPGTCAQGGPGTCGHGTPGYGNSWFCGRKTWIATKQTFYRDLGLRIGPSGSKSCSAPDRTIPGS